MSTGFWIGFAVVAFVAALIGFIVLQRRNPGEADKIAAGLDSAAKKAEQEVKDKFGKK